MTKKFKNSVDAYFAMSKYFFEFSNAGFHCDVVHHRCGDFQLSVFCYKDSDVGHQSPLCYANDADDIVDMDLFTAYEYNFLVER